MKVPLYLAIAGPVLALAACAQSEPECSGFILTPAGDKSTFTVPELMAHAQAMGMTQQEAETLIYLEGISSSANVEPGRPLCIDGKPG